jgi:hypothetical protein
MTVRSGPLTKDTTTIALGLAQIRIGPSAANITKQNPVLAESASLGALASTSFTSNAEYFKLESGYPLLEDATFPLREAAMLECAFKEMTPANFALAKGFDPADYTSAHTGVVPLGAISTPAFLRMEAIYTYPDGLNTMNIVFPRCQVTSAIEAEFAEEEPAAVAVQIEAKRADSGITGGNSAWDDKPLGLIRWNDGSTLTTTTTTTTTTT